MAQHRLMTWNSQRNAAPHRAALFFVGALDGYSANHPANKPNESKIRMRPVAPFHPLKERRSLLYTLSSGCDQPSQAAIRHARPELVMRIGRFAPGKLRQHGDRGGMRHHDDSSPFIPAQETAEPFDQMLD